MKAKKRKEQSGSRDFVRRSNLYQEFLAEREEILRHKWIESEKAGYDVGFERALLDWIRKHRDEWRQSRRNDTQKPFPLKTAAN
ncbi:hypothetical protein [Rubellicoccus peritrichatus]|uniref:DUF4032 domain-containing protein n=1 Tax=Rubellicoccus peritrichatus TaxID=3080537 RepID=A0AAQ3LFY4_9BACT|nr:hypothetical protein [Puniceicoccus sp. CR14]WOO43093.1 hypothetical protein RZN69_08305 [Puniceicoccus sp. CR14]